MDSHNAIKTGWVGSLANFLGPIPGIQVGIESLSNMFKTVVVPQQSKGEWKQQKARRAEERKAELLKAKEEAGELNPLIQTAAEVAAAGAILFVGDKTSQFLAKKIEAIAYLFEIDQLKEEAVAGVYKNFNSPNEEVQARYGQATREHAAEGLRRKRRKPKVSENPPSIQREAEVSDNPPSIQREAEVSDNPPSIRREAEVSDNPPSITSETKVSENPPSIVSTESEINNGSQQSPLENDDRLLLTVGLMAGGLGAVGLLIGAKRLFSAPALHAQPVVPMPLQQRPPSPVPVPIALAHLPQNPPVPPALPKMPVGAAPAKVARLNDAVLQVAIAGLKHVPPAPPALPQMPVAAVQAGITPLNAAVLQVAIAGLKHVPPAPPALPQMPVAMVPAGITPLNPKVLNIALNRLIKLKEIKKKIQKAEKQLNELKIQLQIKKGGRRASMFVQIKEHDERLKNLQKIFKMLNQFQVSYRI